MASRHAGRIKKLEDKMMIGKPGLLIVQTDYGETSQQRLERVKKEYPDYEKLDLIFVMNFGNIPTSGVDEQIREEERKIIEIERKTKKAAGAKKKKEPS